LIKRITMATRLRRITGLMLVLLGLTGGVSPASAHQRSEADVALLLAVETAISQKP
jgi:hypothetical protein